MVMKRLAIEGIDYLLLTISMIIVFQIKTAHDNINGVEKIFRDAAFSIAIGFSAIIIYAVLASVFKKAQAVILVFCILSNLLLCLL